jgi:hypothetical protein
MNTNLKSLYGGLTGALTLIVTSTASAVSVDLTTAGSQGTANGALFVQIDPQTTGTGVIEPFLRIQNNNTEEGYNSSSNSLFADTKAGTWTHDILLGAIPIVKVSGTDYYQFLLDINENVGSDHELLSLHEVEIYLRTSAIDPADTKAALTAGGPASFDLDVGADGDSKVELNYNLNPGSGAGDMFMYIPVSKLGTDGSKYLYLYSAFGVPNDSDDGFEEWAVLEQPTHQEVPDGGTTFALLGGVLMGIETLRRKLNSSRKA